MNKEFMIDYINDCKKKEVLSTTEEKICEIFNDILNNKYDASNELRAIINIINANSRYMTAEFRERLIMEINHSIKLIKGKYAK